MAAPTTTATIWNDKLLKHSLYASGNFGKSCLGSFVELFALFYLTDMLKIPAAIAGMVLFVSLIWDAVTDPFMGIAADRLRTKFPTVRVYFLIGAPLTAITFIAAFQTYMVPQHYRVIYIFSALILFRTAYTIVDIPHNGMLSFLSKDSRDRTNIASLRIFFSAAGKLAVTLTMTAVFAKANLVQLQKGFSAASFIFSAVYLVVIGICLVSIWNIEIHSDQSDDQPIEFLDLLKKIAANSQLMIVFALTAVTSLATPMIGSAIVYYGKYGLKSTQQGATALVIMAAAQAASLLFWSKLSNRLRQKKSAAQYANGLLAVAMLVAVFALGSYQTLDAVAALAGFAIGGIFMLNWSMLPDALDYNSHLSSYRYNMSVFGLYTLTNKSFIGLSQAVVGITLAAYGYKADGALMGDTISSIVSTLMTFPLLGALACVLILRRHTQVQTHKQ